MDRNCSNKQHTDNSSSAESSRHFNFAVWTNQTHHILHWHTFMFEQGSIGPSFVLTSSNISPYSATHICSSRNFDFSLFFLKKIRKIRPDISYNRLNAKSYFFF